MNRYLSLMAAAVASAAMFGCSHSGSSYSSTDDMSRPTSADANNNTAMDSQTKTNGDRSAAYSNGADKQPYANNGTSKYNDGSSMGSMSSTDSSGSMGVSNRTGATAGTMSSTGTYSSGSGGNQPLHSGDTSNNNTSGSVAAADATAGNNTGMTSRQTGSPSQGATGDTNQGQTRSNNTQDQTVQAMNGQGPNTATVANANLSDQDKTFVSTAASSGMFEVQSSKLALQNTQNADLKAMAQHMIDDHTKVNSQLTDLASKDGLTPSTNLATKDQQNLDALQKASGADFDKLYTQQQIQAHQDAVSLFQQEADSGQNADLKSFASQNLPTLKDHLKMFQDSSSKMANDR